jgi:hypothetical protein
MKNLDYKSIVDINDVIKTRAKSKPSVSNRKVSKYLSIREASVDDILPQWLEYVNSNKHAEIYNHPLWVKALENEYQRKAVILYCEDEHSEIKGVLPLLPTLGIPFNNEPVAARRLSSLPRTPIGGFLFDSANAGKLLIEKAIGKIGENPKTLLQLKSLDENLNEDIDGLVKIPWRNAYFIELPLHPESIRFGNKKQHYNRRKDAGQAKKLGVVVRPAETEDDLKEWYKLYCETMRWHAVPVRSYRFFKFLWENLSPENSFTLLLAETKEGTKTILHSGSLFLKFNKTVSYAFNGRRESAFKNHANDYIQWVAIHRACKDGYKYYDMGEASDNNNLSMFKAKWGCSTRQIYHYYYSRGRNVNTGHLDNSNDAGIVKKIWRRLPLPVTNSVGFIVNYFL